MAHAEGDVTIDRPAATVFNFLLDGMNNPEWRPTVLDIQRVPGIPPGVGARFKQGLKGPGGRRIDGDYEITASEPEQTMPARITSNRAWICSNFPKRQTRQLSPTICDASSKNPPALRRRCERPAPPA